MGIIAKCDLYLFGDMRVLFYFCSILNTFSDVFTLLLWFIKVILSYLIAWINQIQNLRKMKILPSSRLMSLCLCVYLCVCICGQKKTQIVSISSNLGRKYPLFLLERICFKEYCLCCSSAYNSNWR